MNQSSSVTLQENVGLQSEVKVKKLNNYIYLFVKRIIDILFGIVGMIAMIPLAFIIKAVSICHRDYNSIFYKQERIGKNGKIFNLYKFRSMVPDADNVLYKLLEEDDKIKEEYTLNKKLKDDPRVTKIGKFLRKTSLDEVPQFINIFLGQMTLIGNRPYLPREKEDMGSYYNAIVSTKPGLSGLWQVSGRSNTTFDERLIIESRYSRTYNIKTDIQIFFKTIIQVLRKEGAN